MSEKLLSWFAGMVICTLVLAGGCEPAGEEAGQLKVKPGKVPAKPEITGPVAIAFKFAPQDVTTYKVTLDEEMSLKFEGELSKKEQFQDKRNHDVVEITFTQQIQNINRKGNWVAKITIDKLKYFQVYKNNITIDFDGTRRKDQNHPLAKLIGQSYTVEIAPTGKIAKIVDVVKARAAIKGMYSTKEAVSKLLYPDKIKNRHGTLVLPAIDKNQLQTGESWSGTKIFSFNIVGPQPHEKIYTLKEIKTMEGRQIAVVEMSGVPSTELAEQLHKEQVKEDFADIFSNTETYSGRLEFDLTSGKVEKYYEKLETEWVIMDPEASVEVSSALKMGAVLVYRLEKVD